MWICFNNAVPEPASLVIGNDVVERVESQKLLGAWYENYLKWNCHIGNVVKKVNKRLYSLRKCRRANLPLEVGITCYQSKIRLILEYAAPVWNGLPEYLVDEIEIVQNRCLKILETSRHNLETLDDRRENLTQKEFQRIQRDPKKSMQQIHPPPPQLQTTITN